MIPKEEVLDKEQKGKQLKITVLAEQNPYETRIPVTPQGVELLTDNGHTVFVENGAGAGSRFTDNDYSEGGANLVKEKKDLFESDVLLKVSPLLPEEINLLRPGQTLVTSLHLATRDENYFRSLIDKRVTAIAFELLKDDYHEFPILRSMCEIAGTVSVRIGAQYLSSTDKGKGILLGGITGVTPTEVVILGAGTAAEYAARTVIGMGGVVKIFDHAIPALQRIKQRIGREVFTSVLHPPVLKKTLETADLVISTLQRLDRRSFFLVPEDMIMGMKKGSVVLDIHIDQGSSFETGRPSSQSDPVYLEHGVIHYMAPNITAMVPRTASIALSNVIIPLLLNSGKSGGIQQLIRDDLGARHGVYLFNGILTHEMIGNYFGIPSKDIDLLLAAF
jgi:alanine dehydrogenase